MGPKGKKKAAPPAEGSSSRPAKRGRPANNEDAPANAPDVEVPPAVPHHNDAAGEPVAGQEVPIPRNRNFRDAQARVARERAAHFARADQADASPAPSAPRPAEVEEWCGPFATARKLMNERANVAAARQERQDRIARGENPDADDMNEDEDESTGDQPAIVVPAVKWNGTGRGSTIGVIARVPALFQLCLEMLADQFEYVEELGEVTPEVRNRLAALLCRRLQLTPTVLHRLAAEGVTEVVLPDCSRIDESEMKDALLRCRPTLTCLELRMCGRCITDSVALAVAAAGGFPCLRKLVLTGLYQLSDDQLAMLLARPSNLLSTQTLELDISQNCRLGAAGLKTIMSVPLSSLSLTLCEQLDATMLETLAESLPVSMKRLNLSGLPKLTDGIVVEILKRCGPSLVFLHLEDCESLTDISLTAISDYCRRQSTSNSDTNTNTSVTALAPASTANSPPSTSYGVPTDSNAYAISNGSYDGIFGSSSVQNGLDESKGGGLDELYLGRCPNFTASGVAALFMVAAKVDGAGGSGLRTLSLRGLSSINDGAVIAAATACAGRLRTCDISGTSITDATLLELIKHCGATLANLDLSFCHGVTDAGVGTLVDSCDRIDTLSLWGAMQIGDAFLKKHSKEDLRVLKS